ncbi:MAG: tetratricopeptide repeat protein [Planctomycetota bacterium]|jgi:hypothetical protein
MTAKNNLEDKLEELGKVLGSDESFFENVMSSIDAKTIVSSNGIERRYAIGLLMKLAAVVAIVSAVAVSINLLGRSAPVAYAVEQTVEAFRSVRYVHVVQRDEAGHIKDERWIEIGPDGMQARYRQDTPPNLLVVDNRETIFKHRKNKNTVWLTGPEEQYTYYWIAPLGEVFKSLAGEGSVTIEENVNYRDQKAHRVRWLMTNQECYIDPESKLPITLLGYDISYEEPPEDIFDIPGIPDGVTLIDKRPGAPEIPEPTWTKEGEITKEQFKQARHALANGQLREAAALLAKVVEVGPSLNWAWFWLGKAHYELGEYDTAIHDFSKVIDMRTKNKSVPHYCYLARGLAYKAKGMKDMGQQDLNIALPVMIGALRNIKGAFPFDYADDPLFRDGPKEKWPTAPQSLTAMISRLRAATGHNLGYRPDVTLEEKERAIAAWEEWHKTSGQIKLVPDAEIHHVPKVTEGGDE